MRFFAIIGGLIALGLGSVSHRGFSNAAALAAAPTLMLAPPGGGYIGGGSDSARPARTQRHTGAGGAGMHKAWKRRRASGRS